MARSHHRKKHKEHLRQFKNKTETTWTTPKSKAANVFAIAGAIVGLAISYFSTEGSLLWIGIGVAVGTVAGFMVGRRVDAN